MYFNYLNVNSFTCPANAMLAVRAFRRDVAACISKSYGSIVRVSLFCQLRAYIIFKR
jgi:hypothetical protein